MKTNVSAYVCIIALSIVIASCKKPEVAIDDLNYNVYDPQYNGSDYISINESSFDTIDFGNWIDVYHTVGFGVNTDVFVNGISPGTKMRIKVLIESPGYENDEYIVMQPISLDDPVVSFHPYLPGSTSTMSYEVYLVKGDLTLKQHNFQFSYP